MKRLTCLEEQNRSSFFQSGCCLCHIHPDRQTLKSNIMSGAKLQLFTETANISLSFIQKISEKDDSRSSSWDYETSRPIILTFLAFCRKIHYLCKSEAGPPYRKPRFFYVFTMFSKFFLPYSYPKIPVLQFKFQVFVLKFRYGLFTFHYLKPIF